MTTAKEEIAKRIEEGWDKEDLYYAAGRHEQAGAKRGASIANGVWEPLLKDLLKAYEHAVEYGGKGHRLLAGDAGDVFAWGGYTRAKEALGL